jgi:hypothetical protein
MKKIIHILESVLLLSLIWTFRYHYDPYSSTPQFQLNTEVLFDTYRVIIDVLIWSGLIFRIIRLIKRRFNPINNKIANLDLTIFIGYTILILPDLWIFIKWYYFGKAFGLVIIILLSPWLFWLYELYLSISEFSLKTRLKRIGFTALGIFITIGLTWAYLYSIKLEIEKDQKEEVVYTIKTHPNN